MLESYSTLKEKIDNKNRGRKNEVNICKSPELWARRYGEDIRVHLERGSQVATLHPDNSMEITFGSWHTQYTTEIIHTLSGTSSWLYMNHVWFDDMPTEGGKIRFNQKRFHTPPERFVRLKDTVISRCAHVELRYLSPPMRLRFELRDKDPQPAVTRKVKDYATCKIPLDTLSLRDIWTCMSEPNAVVRKCFEEAI